jgi:hypothetical protein
MKELEDIKTRIKRMEKGVFYLDPELCDIWSSEEDDCWDEV